MSGFLDEALFLQHNRLNFKQSFVHEESTDILQLGERESKSGRTIFNTMAGLPEANLVPSVRQCAALHHQTTSVCTAPEQNNVQPTILKEYSGKINKQAMNLCSVR